MADIVGYSAQMERDETGTFARLTARRRDLFEPEIARHNGRIFKLTGDGLLAEFGSAVQAVECAMVLQAGLADRNTGLPDDERITARIGINLGEVIVDGDDRLGEGVNIAARLEQLADPGGICVSAKVAREVTRKLAFGFESMGERRVKNISEPIHVYRVSLDVTKRIRRKGAAWPVWRLAAGVAAVLALGAALWWGLAPAARHGPPVLAVLPFANLSGDPTQDHLGPGIAEGIITMLSTSPLLQVASRTSGFRMPATARAQDIARDLGAAYLLEGSLRRQGDVFHVSTQLVDARDGRNLWADRLEQDGGDIVAMQEAVARKVYATVAGSQGQVPAMEQSLTWAGSAPPLGEYEYHLRGGVQYLAWTEAGKAEAERIWTEGLERFPDSAILRLELATLFKDYALEGPTDDPWADIQRAQRLVDEVRAKPDKSRLEVWLTHQVRATLLQPAEGDFEGSVREARAARAMVPYDPLTSIGLSLVMANAGQGAIAVEWAEYAVANEAVVPEWYRDRLAWAYWSAGRTEDAMRVYDAINDCCVPCKVSTLVRMGRLVEANAEIARYIPDWTLEDARTYLAGRQTVMVDRLLGPYLDDLRKAGLA